MLTWQILGWGTAASQLVGSGWLVYYLVNAGREPRSWMRRVPVPKYSEVPLTLSSGSDHVGLV